MKGTHFAPLMLLVVLSILMGCDQLQNLSLSKTDESLSGSGSAGGLAPRTFNLQYPADGATGVSVTPTLSWEQTTDPEGGRIAYTVSLNSAQGTDNRTTTVQDTSYTVLTPLLPETTYYWRVTAEDPDGNTRRSPFRSFTTAAGSGSGTGGGGQTFGLTQSNVRKGVILHNPNLPAYFVYLYIDSAMNVYSRSSSDGGSTWSAPVQISGLSNTRDLAAVLCGNGNAVAIFIDNATNDSGAGARVVTSVLLYGSNSWDAPAQKMGSSYPALRRLPSAIRTVGNQCLLAFGYDTNGGASGDDTNAYTLYWDGNYFVSQDPVGLPGQTDNPVYCQQIAFDSYTGTMYYLYFDNHMDWEANGGDMFLIQGSYPSTWFGPSETRVVNANSYERPSQGYLFKGSGGNLILIYALETVSPSSNVLNMRTGTGPADLQFSPDTTLESSLAVPSDSYSRYRTVYAAQDTGGNIHVVWQDASNTIKWCKIDGYTLQVVAMDTVATNKLLDSISVGSSKLYISVLDADSYSIGDVIQRAF